MSGEKLVVANGWTRRFAAWGAIVGTLSLGGVAHLFLVTHRNENRAQDYRSSGLTAIGHVNEMYATWSDLNDRLNKLEYEQKELKKICGIPDLAP